MSESIAIVSATGETIERQDEVLPIYSITKSYIAASIFAAGIDIETRISKWFAAEIVPRGSEILVRQLLNHTSGLPDYGSSPKYLSAIQTGEVWTDEDFIDLTLQTDLLFEPGERWAYSNPGYWLLSQIVQKHCDLSFADYIEKFVLVPLRLQQTRVESGIFADDLVDYPANWVWHGLLVANAHEVVEFMNSELVKPLLALDNLTRVPIVHPDWVNPSWGYGLMVDPEVRYGHNGDGPKYSAACFRSFKSGKTGCVLCSASSEGLATSRLISMLD